MIKKFGGAILTFALVFGAIAATGLTAQAQYRRDGRWERNRDDDRRWRNDDRRWRNDDRRWRNRRNDRLRGRGYNNGRYGYPGNNNGRYGNGRNGGYGDYGSNYELNRGYQQGLSTGSSDARRGQSYSPQRSRHYRNASSQAFLQGFVRGYDQGYRQYAGYNNGYRNNNGSIWSQILGLP